MKEVHRSMTRLKSKGLSDSSLSEIHRLLSGSSLSWPLQVQHMQLKAPWGVTVQLNTALLIGKPNQAPTRWTRSPTTLATWTIVTMILVLLRDVGHRPIARNLPFLARCRHRDGVLVGTICMESESISRRKQHRVPNLRRVRF